MRNRYGRLCDNKNESLYNGEWFNDNPLDSTSLNLSIHSHFTSQITNMTISSQTTH